MILPGGGISLDGRPWISFRPTFLLPVCVRRARGRFLSRLIELHAAGQLAFLGAQAVLTNCRLFLSHLAAVRKKRFVVYAKPPFAGPEVMLAYFSRYTHRVAISNRRLISFNETGVTFRYNTQKQATITRDSAAICEIFWFSDNSG
jgi:Putative transposase